MQRIALLGLVALGTSLAATGDAHAWGLPPVKVNLTFRVDVHSLEHPAPMYPWWTYFPYDPHLMTPASRPHYPNWPAPAPVRQTSLPGQPTPPSNIVWQHAAPDAYRTGAAPGMVQPAGYRLPGFAFDR
jgi:hypothetical protein